MPTMTAYVMPQNDSVRHQIRDVLVPLVAMFLASRLVLLVLASMTLQLSGAHGANSSLAPMLCRWDCEWYLGIAQHGYSTYEPGLAYGHAPGETTFGFYPLYPLIVRFFTPLMGGDVLHAGILVSNLCFLAALFYVYLYVRELGLNRSVGLLTACMLCVFPQSIVFSAPLSESIFLLLMAAAMYHFRREQYLVAGIAAALLTAVRPNGILFIVFAGVLLVQQHGLRAVLAPWRMPEKFVPIVLAPLGMFLFLTYCYVATGDAFAHESTESIGWGWAFVPPWENLLEQLHSGSVLALCAAISISVALCSLLLLQYGMYAEFAFCIASILLIWCGQGVVSLFRYWMILFPIWIAVARSVAVRPMGATLLCALLGMISGVIACAWALGSIIAL
ncbi:hypothetical protein EKH79_18125 [Dyella dinghuensis]|uniref:Glycosyltransferase RgtA/B/C/D-like domain-containing protein n=2 Tax=Dyella dinghuensis TaxID=1920169 RepID=A0A432LNY1_9GAMM|nr:hypothetical protein EKH79_18125 [Dyella dinghuensis]